jgi:hypothetical protein
MSGMNRPGAVDAPPNAGWPYKHGERAGGVSRQLRHVWFIATYRGGG